MKRKIAWLALPLVLAALILGVKWRAEHPTPTEEDLEIRALMSKSSLKKFGFYSRKAKTFNSYTTPIRGDDLAPFLECFYLSPQSDKLVGSTTINSGAVRANWFFSQPEKDNYSGLIVAINVDSRVGKVVSFGSYGTSNKNIHPVTVKRWMELLLTNARIGPEIRARVKS